MDQERLNETERFFHVTRKSRCHYMTVFDGNDECYHIDLDEFGKNEVIFGREDSSHAPDICLKSRIVSRLHGRFIFEKGRWWIEDQHSLNGIFCNGELITRRELIEGDMFRIQDEEGKRDDCVLFVMSSDQPEYGWFGYPITTDEFKIGRGTECDLTISHISVSRIHAVLRKENDEWFILDQNSENGILVNDDKVTGKQLLHNKDVITIINIKMVFTGSALYVGLFGDGMSVDAADLVVKRKKGRKEMTACDHVSFQINPGELVSIIGGPGAGKSTLMKVLCGYLPPDQGSVSFNGVDLYRNFNSLKSLFGYVPQQDVIYGDLTLYEMLRYAAELRLPRDSSAEEKEEAIHNAIALVGLDGERNSLISKLSGEQKKRASIAAELIPDPKLLFLDEPACGLDPGTERSLMQILRGMTETGKTVILITNSTLQMEMCDRIIFLGKGGWLCYFGDLQDAESFFDADDVTDIYAKLADESAQWQEKYREANPPSRGDMKSEKPALPEKKNRIHQLAVLCKRCAKRILNDRQRLIILLAQAPVLSLLMFLVLDGSQFKHYEMTKSLFFCLTCSGFWIGMQNSVQEICKEKTILKREYMTGLSLTSYILSKAVVIGVLCLIQSGLLVGAMVCLTGMMWKTGLLPVLEVYLTTWLTVFSAASMGLFVSCLVSKPDRVTAAAPILLMLQMLFSGMLFTLSGVIEKISWFMVCRWSMEGYGTAVRLNDLPNVLQRMGFLAEREAESFFEYTPGHMWKAWLILAGFIVFFILLSRMMLTRVRREK